MPKNDYRITLYNTQFFSEVLTYKFPILPTVGDMIEVINQRTMFVVQNRSFHPRYETGLIDVTLHGVFENGEDMGRSTFDKVLVRIRDEQEQLRTMDFATDRQPFPTTLD